MHNGILIVLLNMTRELQLLCGLAPLLLFSLACAATVGGRTLAQYGDEAEDGPVRSSFKSICFDLHLVYSYVLGLAVSCSQTNDTTAPTTIEAVLCAARPNQASHLNHVVKKLALEIVYLPMHLTESERVLRG